MKVLSIFKSGIHRFNLRIVISALHFGLASVSLGILRIYTLAKKAWACNRRIL